MPFYDSFPYFKDFDSAYAMVRSRMLHWTPGDGRDWNDICPSEFLERLYCALPNDQREILVKACLKALLDTEPEVRGGVIEFFIGLPTTASIYSQSLPNIDVSDAFIDAITNHGELFEGVNDPCCPHKSDLYSRLDLLISQRAKKGDQRVIQFLRKEVLKPGKASYVIGGLTDADKEWVLSHVEDIVRNSPDALIPLLWHMNESDADLSMVISKVLNVLPVAQVIRYIKSRIPLRSFRDKILHICDLRKQEQDSR